jgi:hypothetical protein
MASLVQACHPALLPKLKTRGDCTMRKTIATLSALAALAVAGVSAGPAAADDPNVIYYHGGTLGGSQNLSCQTQMKRGVLGQYGAGGYYLDGCTVKLDCPRDFLGAPVQYCLANSQTTITTSIPRGDQVTMNGRIRTFNSAGQVTGWSDKSCAGAGSCTTTDSMIISPGGAASVQCNGVRAPTWDNLGRIKCFVEMKRR